MKRVQDLDAVRGFALFGIFAVNVTFMASGYPGHLVTDPAFRSAVDDAVRTMSSVLIGMKFYVLFSFLFGYSFTLQMDAARRAGAAFGARMLRRITGLVVLGALHTVLLYGGDVLTTYAVACVVLLVMRDVPDRRALQTAGGLYALVLAGLVTSALVVDPAAFRPSEAEAPAGGEAATRALLGGWPDVVAVHLDGLPLLALQAVSLQGPTALALFLAGMVAGRRRLLAGVTGSEPVLRRLQWIGFPAGLLGSSVYAAGGNGDTLAVAAGVAAAPLLAAAYVATLLRVAHHPRTAAVRDALAPAGRMALTNYLGQSVIGLVAFTGVGFGLAGALRPGALLLFAVAVFAAQLAVSALWLRTFRYGPAEWLLRWLTNARRPELLRVEAAPPHAA